MAGIPDFDVMWWMTLTVGQAFGARDTSRIISKGRDVPTIVLARKVSMYVVRRLTKTSYPKLGRFFQRDHTTAMYGVSYTAHRCTVDPTFAGVVYRLLLELG